MKNQLLKILTTAILATTATSAQSAPTNIEVAKNVSHELEKMIEYVRINADAETATPGYGIDFERLARTLGEVKAGVDQLADYPIVIPIDPTTLKPIADDFQN